MAALLLGGTLVLQNTLPWADIGTRLVWGAGVTDVWQPGSAEAREAICIERHFVSTCTETFSDLLCTFAAVDMNYSLHYLYRVHNAALDFCDEELKRIPKDIE